MSKSTKPAARKAAVRRDAKGARRSRAPKQQKRQTKPVAPPVSAKSGASATGMPRSKKAIIVALLQRPDGAPISTLTGATGWQAHSVRAALTGLRKEGKDLTRIRDTAGITHYRITAAA